MKWRMDWLPWEIKIKPRGKGSSEAVMGTLAFLAELLFNLRNAMTAAPKHQEHNQGVRGPSEVLDLGTDLEGEKYWQ